MPCYVYILYSKKWERYYVGITNDLVDRLKRHSNGQSLSTKGGIPWKMIYKIYCEDKSAAMSLETKVKKRGIIRYLADNNIFSGL